MYGARMEHTIVVPEAATVEAATFPEIGPILT
jgi:hypothetical protein